MKRIFFGLISKVLPMNTALAHCDIPCGIYDPKPAQIAAATVLKMVKKIVSLSAMDAKDVESKRNYHNSMTRFVLIKEDHARKCKEEILILWTDYFKPERLEMFPNLHETFWKTAKLCSKNKQEVNLESAQKLVKAVDEISSMFEKAEGIKKKSS